MKPGFVLLATGLLFALVVMVVVVFPSRPAIAIPCTSPQHVGGACSSGPVSTPSPSQRLIETRKRLIVTHRAWFEAHATRGAIRKYILTGVLGPTAKRPAASRAITLTYIRMVSSSTGWALAKHRVLRTSNGGYTWSVRRYFRSATPLPRQAFTTFGSEDAWILGGTLDHAGQLNGLETTATLNGGRTWHTWKQPFSNTISGFAPSWANFVDAKHGWLTLEVGVGAGSAWGELLRTSDGGRLWTRVEHNYGSGNARGSLPTCDGGVSAVTFRTRRRGWATGECFAAMSYSLYTTSNGGRSWRPQVLPAPHGFKGRCKPLNCRGLTAAYAPTFARGDGILPATFGSPAKFILYRSFDAGMTWLPSRPLKVGPSRSSLYPPRVADSVLDSSHVWALLHGELYATADGGESWTLVARSPGIADAGKHVSRLGGLKTQTAPPTLEFTSTTTGFALSAAGKLRVTVNGGHTWHVIHTVLR
jgi:photosystem II stability/assembly factor-like uncharacterized protein